MVVLVYMDHGEGWGLGLGKDGGGEGERGTEGGWLVL
jgi:hypothetical protein